MWLIYLWKQRVYNVTNIFVKNRGWDIKFCQGKRRSIREYYETSWSEICVYTHTHIYI